MVITLTITPTKFCRLGSARLRILCFAFLIVEFSIVGIGDVTPKGNRTIRMQRNADIETDLGTVVGGRISRIVVRSESFSKEKDDVVDLDMDSTFKFEDRTFTIPEGEENAGQEIELEWVVPV